MFLLPVDVIALSSLIPSNSAHARGLAVTAALSIALLAAGGLYRPRLHLSILDEMPALASRFLSATAIVVFVAALRHDTFEGVDELLRTATVMLVLLLVGRALAMWTMRAARRRRLVGHPTIIVGSGALTAELAQILARYPQYGLHVIGFVDNLHRLNAVAQTVPYLGDLAQLAEVSTHRRAEVIIFSDPDITEAGFADVLRKSMTPDRDILFVPRIHQFQIQTTRPDHIGAIPVMRFNVPTLSGWRWGLKRAIDVIVSALALVLVSPVLAACAIAVRIEGGPGVLFRQQRVGRNGTEFEVLKFRSLRPVDETDSQTTWSVAHDSRVGPVGRFLRRTSLDELPQLWNILRGDMTLVGPRPERPYFVELFSAEHRLYAQRHRVPAGLTGLAQVSGLRGDTPISDRARFDNYYIENWSLWLDFKILLRTVREVVFGGGR
ncbi:sugar transferase [Planosporangium thailandense]|uniref:Sugar transferase n=1 Tax=Planosporangium thailandense TaxID=765197 RepID=A0ABX0XY61_9ACTN|nr:sugar transferase [Planosporangium thailandense]NJC70981.1 sugar transferase [Planosporangium thailandense]